MPARMLLTWLLSLLAALCLGAPPSAGATAPATTGDPDPRWVFYSSDKTWYGSPWFKGTHQKMVPYGCTRAPYYDPDPRCTRERGFHHGLDIAIPCGTPLTAARWGRVVSNDALGPAYGVKPLLIRNDRLGVDFLIAHVRHWRVREGARVRRGQPLAWVSDSAAPDGCHLHFEVRAAGGGLDTARSPLRFLALRPA